MNGIMTCPLGSPEGILDAREVTTRLKRSCAGSASCLWRARKADLRLGEWSFGCLGRSSSSPMVGRACRCLPASRGCCSACCCSRRAPLSRSTELSKSCGPGSRQRRPRRSCRDMSRACGSCFPAGVLVTRPPGYLLRLDGAQLDLARFERLRQEAGAAFTDGRYEAAAQLLRDGWRCQHSCSQGRAVVSFPA